MDEFSVSIQPLPTTKEEEEIEAKLPTKIPTKVLDQEDGTYLVTYTLPKGGKYIVRKREEKRRKEALMLLGWVGAYT